MDGNRVLLDSDFCNMITDIDGGKINSRVLLKKVIEAIGKIPFIHEYVKQHELFDNMIIQEFIEINKIKILQYNEITNNGLYESYYSDVFSQYYRDMNHEEFVGDCFKFRKSKYNLGEIHSLIAARFLGIPLFYTNDKGAGFLAKKYNTQDNEVALISGLDLMINYKDTSLFDRDTCRAIFTKYPNWKSKYIEAIKK